VDYNDGNFVDYTYDALGSREEVNDTGSVTVYDTNCLNQYTDVGPQGSQTPYHYDKNGNLTDDGTYEYYYDCENRLIDVNEEGNPVASYAYDYLGRRISKTVDGNTTKYCYDGDQVIAEYYNGTLARKFIYGPGIDEPICMIAVDGETETVYYYHFDGLGSVAALSNINNVVVESYSYDVFGEPNTASSIGNPYMFTGRRYDPEAGLYYYRARYYAYDIGRFLQTDPIGYAAGLNLYTYCRNNPLNLIDPYGLLSKDFKDWWKKPKNWLKWFLAWLKEVFIPAPVAAIEAGPGVFKIAKEADRINNEAKEDFDGALLYGRSLKEGYKW